MASHQEIATKYSRKHKYSSRTVYCHSGYLDELYRGLHSELVYLYSTQDSGSYTVEGLPHKILRQVFHFYLVYFNGAKSNNLNSLTSAILFSRILWKRRCTIRSRPRRPLQFLCQLQINI